MYHVNVNIMLLFPMTSESVSKVSSVCMSRRSCLLPSLPPTLPSSPFLFYISTKNLILNLYSELLQVKSQKLWNWNLHMLAWGQRIYNALRILRPSTYYIRYIRYILTPDHRIIVTQKNYFILKNKQCGPGSST